MPVESITGRPVSSIASSSWRVVELAGGDLPGRHADALQQLDGFERERRAQEQQAASRRRAACRPSHCASVNSMRFQ